MAKFDLAKTSETLRLLQTPEQARDAAWRARFYAAVVDASFAANPEQVMSGPDGFPYFVLVTPPTGVGFEPFCISHILEHCTDRGCGIALNPGPTGVDWVFKYGDLWSLRAYGRFEGDPSDEPGEGGGVEVVERGREIMVGQPSDEFFPSWARNVVRAYLQGIGVAQPKVMLIMDEKVRPKRSLVFNFHAEDFGGHEAFQGELRRLHWFLPLNRGLVGFQRGADELLRHLQPL
jgi:hypothetical protein